MNESEQLLINELRRLDRAIDKRKKAFSALTEAKDKRVFSRRYVLEIPISLRKVQGEFSISYTVDTQPVTRSFVVDKDCINFSCREIVYTVAGVGTLYTGSGPTEGRFSFLNTSVLWFQWEVRDTYTDRAWQNLPMPDLALGSGKTSGLPLGRPAVLLPGTEVSFTVRPLTNYGLLPIEQVGFVPTSYALQVSFVGTEVLG